MNLVCCFQFQVMSNITFLFEKSNKNLTGHKDDNLLLPDYDDLDMLFLTKL